MKTAKRKNKDNKDLIWSKHQLKTSWIAIKEKWVVIQQMEECANINYFASQSHLKVNYNEIYSWLKNQMNFRWRKASQRPPRCFQNSLEDARKIFIEFILKLKEACFVIVWIDESSFSSASLPLYSWMLNALFDQVLKDIMLLLHNGTKNHVL